MPYEVRLTIFIILVIIVFSSLLIWIFYPIIRKFLLRKRYKEIYFRHIDHIVKINDYYLINTFSMDIEGAQLFMIDHLIGGDKYLYVVIDYYVDGAMEIDLNEPYATIYKKDNVKLKMANPIRMVEHTVNSLATFTNIPRDFFVGIALINDDMELVEKEKVKTNVNLVRLSKLDKFILQKEKNNVKPLAKKELWQTIQDLHRIKENAQKRKQTTETIDH